jgi:hypothetical protein
MSFITYRKYKITTITELLGSCPANPELYRDYILSKSPDQGDLHSDEIGTEPHAHLLKAKQEMDAAPTRDQVDPDEAFTKQITAFPRHPQGDGLILYDYQFMGFLKESANNLKDALGIKNLRAKVDKYVSVFPRLTLIADGPDGILQRSLRANTAQGPRTALTASEVLYPPLEFEIIIGLVKNSEIQVKSGNKVELSGWDIIEKFLAYGAAKKGLLQWRNGGYGKFVFERLGELDPEKTGLPVI